MGYSALTNILTRRGVSVPQMRNLGLLDPFQTVSLVSDSVGLIASGYLNTTIDAKLFRIPFQNGPGKKERKERKINCGEERLVSFRSSSLGIDYHLNVTSSGSLADDFFNPMKFRSFSDAVFIHSQNGDSTVDLNGVLQVGEEYIFEDGRRIKFLCSVS